MPDVQAQLDALDEAIASGVQTIRSPDGKMVAYQSVEHMLKARQVLVAKLQALNAVGGWPSTRRVARFSSGLASSTSES